MTSETYRHPADCREVWLRLANRFPEVYNPPPARVCGSAREALATIVLTLGNSPQRAALAFRNWLAEYDLKTENFETAIREFGRMVEREDKYDEP